MAIITAFTWVPWTVGLLGDIVDMDSSTVTGTIDGFSVRGWTNVVAGLNPRIVLAAEDACFFADSNPCVDPVWTLTSGELPFGVRLDPATGPFSISSSVIIVLGPGGDDDFTVTLTDSCGNNFNLTFHTTTPTTPPAAPTPNCCWNLGALWSITTLCAYQGTYGLQRTADGVLGTSDTTNTITLNTASGQTYFISFWAKGSGGADGLVELGFKFFDVNDNLISALFVPTTGSPTTWTQFLGNITAPANAVTAIPTIRAVGHFTGTWCIDQTYLILTGGYWILSGIKHYYDDYTAYR